MKKTSEYRSLSSDDEVSSIIYAVLCTVSKIEKRSSCFYNFNPLVFIIKSLFEEDFPILRDSSFITRDGGAKYVMNDVSSYRAAKGYEVDDVAHLTDLFSRYGCSNCIDIINFIYGIYLERDTGEFIYDDAVKKALMAYRVYYKNNISLSHLPDFKTVAADYLSFMNGSFKNLYDFALSSSDYSGSSLGNKAVTFNHLRYPEVKMLIVADGSGNVLDENVVYNFCDCMNEWFWQCDPYSSCFEEDLKKAIMDINYKISLDNSNLEIASASVFVCTDDKFYISSVGTTRVYLMRNSHLERINRVETLGDDAESSSDLLFGDFMQSVPASYMGYDVVDPAKCNAEVMIFPASDFDGVLAVTKGVYDNVSLEELEKSVFDNESLTVLYDIVQKLPLCISSSLAIYQKKKRTKKRLFSKKKS